jgi:hypothetical protein
MKSNYIIWLGGAANPQHVRVGGSAGESMGFGRENLTKLCFDFGEKHAAVALPSQNETEFWAPRFGGLTCRWAKHKRRLLISFLSPEE